MTLNIQSIYSKKDKLSPTLQSLQDKTFMYQPFVSKNAILPPTKQPQTQTMKMTLIR